MDQISPFQTTGFVFKGQDKLFRKVLQDNNICIA